MKAIGEHPCTLPHRVEGLSVACAVILAIAFFSDAYPYHVPLYPSVVLLIFFWFGLIRQKFAVPLNFGAGLLAGSIILYLIGILNGGVMYEHNIKDLQNMCGLCLTVPLFFALATREQFQGFRNTLIFLCTMISGVISVLGLVKYRLLQQGVVIGAFLVESRPYPWGTSLTLDYNFFALALLVGAISSLYSLWEAHGLPMKMLCSVCLMFSLVCMAFAGSRRGWVTETVFLMILAFLLLRGAAILATRSVARAQLSRNGLKTFAAIAIVGTMATFVFILKPPNAGGAAGGGEQARAHQEELLHRLASLTAPEDAFSGRTDRWRYAMELLEGSSLTQIMFGQGFKYLVQYEQRFLDVSEDYPHNPVMSALFYSGLIGASVALLLLAAPIFIYLRYRRQDSYFCALYFAALWYVLPSFHTLFSGKFFLLLATIPWLIKSVYSRSTTYDPSSHFSNEPAYARFAGDAAS